MPHGLQEWRNDGFYRLPLCQRSYIKIKFKEAATADVRRDVMDRSIS
jgi:hypothetical protein